MARRYNRTHPQKSFIEEVCYSYNTNTTTRTNKPLTNPRLQNPELIMSLIDIKEVYLNI